MSAPLHSCGNKSPLPNRFWANFPFLFVNGLAASVVWGFMLAFCFFSEPTIDDLNRATSAREIGLIESVQWEYNNWSGRWLGVGISYAVGGAADLTKYYPLILLTYIFLLFAGLVSLLRFTVCGPFTWLSAIFCGFVGLAIYWNHAPAPGETFYWATGGLENHVSLAIIFASFTTFLRVTDSFAAASTKLTALKFILASTLSALISGFHELYACVWMTLAASAVLFSLAMGAHTRVTLFWCLITVAAIGGFLIVLLAPGNDVRISNFEDSKNIKLSLLLTLHQILMYLRPWMANPTQLAASFALLLAPTSLPSPAWLRTHKTLFRIGVPLVGLALILGCFFAGGYSRGKPLGERPLNAVHLLFLVFWFATLLIWKWTLPTQDHHGSDELRQFAQRLALLLLSMFLVTSGHMATGAIADLRDRAIPYREVTLERYHLAKQAKVVGQVDLVVPPRTTRPGIFNEVDLNEDPTSAPNVAFARYFGLESVRVQQADDDPDDQLNPPNDQQAVH